MMRFVADVSAGTYAAYLTGPGGVEQTLGTDLAFRVPVTQLDTFALFAETGAIEACDLVSP